MFWLSRPKCVEEQRDHAAERGRADREDHGERHGPALVLCDKEEVAEGQREDQQVDDPPLILVFLVAHVGPTDLIVFGELLVHDVLDHVHHLAGAEEGHALGVDVGGGEHVEALHLARTEYPAHGGQRVERDEFPGRARNVELAYDVQVAAVVARRLHLDLVGLAELVEVVDVRGTELALQRSEDRADRDLHSFGLVAVDVEVEHRSVRVEGGEGVDRLAALHDPAHEVARGLRQLLRGLSAGRLKREGDAAGRAESLNGGRHEHRDLGVGQREAARGERSLEGAR